MATASDSIRSVVPKQIWIHLRAMVVTALIYFFSSRVGLAFVVQSEGLAAVWPSSGVALAILAFYRRRLWPAILAGIFVANVFANLTSGSPLTVSLGFAVANCLESLVATWLFVLFVPAPVCVNTRQDVLVLVGVCAGLSNAITALVGAAVPTTAFGASFWDVWRVWWIADAVGMIIIAPAILNWAAMKRDELLTLVRQQGVELILATVALAGVAQFVFGFQGGNQHVLLTSPYLTFPFLFVAAYRFGIRGAATTVLVLAAIAVWNTAQGVGPFAQAGQTVTEQVLGVQIFLIVAAVTAFLLAATVMERKRVEEALRRSETHFRRLMENAPVAILMVDEAGQIALANERVEVVFGYQRGEVIGHPVEMLLPLQFREVHKAHRRRFLANPVSREMDRGFDVSGRRKNGTEFPVEIGLSYVVAESGTQALAFVTDLTERNRLEAQRTALVAERERVRVLHHFIADASHDLRTPLTVLKTNLFLLRRELAGQATDRVDMLESNIDRLTQLVTDMLEMAKLDGKKDVSSERIDLRQLVSDTVNLIRPVTDKKRQVLSFEGHGEMPHVVVDRDLFSRAISNLLANASSYTPQGGEIAVRVFEDEDQIAVEVRDTGIGISVEHQPRIFERFWRVDTARGIETGGTGLGLAIVKRIAELHNGHVTVQSVEGQGSTFTLWLPLGVRPPSDFHPNGNRLDVRPKSNNL